MPVSTVTELPLKETTVNPFRLAAKVGATGDGNHVSVGTALPRLQNDVAFSPRTLKCLLDNVGSQWLHDSGACAHEQQAFGQSHEPAVSVQRFRPFIKPSPVILELICAQVFQLQFPVLISHTTLSIR